MRKRIWELNSVEDVRTLCESFDGKIVEAGKRAYEDTFHFEDWDKMMRCVNIINALQVDHNTAVVGTSTQNHWSLGCRLVVDYSPTAGWEYSDCGAEILID